MCLKSKTDFTRVHNAVRVNGTLEINSSNEFRVLVNDGTYAYFDSSECIQITVHDERFRDGSKAVIRIIPNDFDEAVD